MKNGFRVLPCEAGSNVSCLWPTKVISNTSLRHTATGLTFTALFTPHKQKVTYSSALRSASRAKQSTDFVPFYNRTYNQAKVCRLHCLKLWIKTTKNAEHKRISSMRSGRQFRFPFRRESCPIIQLGRISVQHNGGGVFLACVDFGTMFDHSFTACAFFFFFSPEV